MSDNQRRTAAALRDQLALMGQRQVPSNRDGFDEEFDALRSVDQRVRSNHDEFYTAMLGSNMSKNRYREILPNEGTRVQLDPINSRGDGDYINANFVDGRRLFGVPFVYIATQAPLRSTIGDFWRMVFENNSVFIVMLCAEIENGKVKSERYWPDGVGGVMTVGPLTLTLTSENQRHDTIYRTINLRTADGREREVFHMQYVRWPDQGIPMSSAPLMEVIHSLGRSNASVRTPIIVHCSGGVGRTGVFITFHVALALFQMEQPISIPKIVQYLKFCRSGMVQRKDQYLFTYYAVLREMEKMIWSIQSSRFSPSGAECGAAMDAAVNNSDGSPRRRPVQYLPQHPAQSKAEIPRSTLGPPGRPPAEQSLRAPQDSAPEFGATYASSWFERGSSTASTPVARSGGGGASDIEQALRAMQQKTQSFRQTPSQMRSSSGRAPPIDTIYSNNVGHTSARADNFAAAGSYSSSTFAPKLQLGPTGTSTATLKPLSQQASAANSRTDTGLQSVAARLTLDDVAAATAAAPSDLGSTRRPTAESSAREPVARPFVLRGANEPSLTREPSSRRTIDVRDIRRDISETETPPLNEPSPNKYFFSSSTAATLDSSSLAPRSGAGPHASAAAPTSSMSDLEAASKSFHASLFGGHSVMKSERVAKSDLSLL